MHIKQASAHCEDSPVLLLITGCDNPEYPALHSSPLGEMENNTEPLDLSPTEQSGIDFPAAHPGDKLHLTGAIK